MTWNGHGIWCGFGPNYRGFGTENDMEFPRESMPRFLQGYHIFIPFSIRENHFMSVCS